MFSLISRHYKLYYSLYRINITHIIDYTNSHRVVYLVKCSSYLTNRECKNTIFFATRISIHNAACSLKILNISKVNIQSSNNTIHIKIVSIFFVNNDYIF